MATPDLSILQLEEDEVAISSLAGAFRVVTAERNMTCMPKIIAVRPSNLSSALATSTLYDQVHSGFFDAIIINPPAATFCRQSFSRRKGVAPCRDVSWPRGFPWLERVPAEAVRHENEILDFAISLVRAASSVAFRTEKRTRIWLVHPEDRGSKELGSPASLWQLPEIQEFQHLGLARTAFFPCAFDIAGPRSPLGVLSDLPQWNDHDSVVRGWPTFTQKECGGRIVPRLYRGPLQRKCEHADHRPIPRIHAGCCILELSLARCVVKDKNEPQKATPTDGVRIAEKLRAVRPIEVENKEVSEHLAPKDSEKKNPPRVPPPPTTTSIRTEQSASFAPSAAEIGDEASRRTHEYRVDEPDTEADEDGLAEGSGWSGRGDPIEVGLLHSKRLLIDGGGWQWSWRRNSKMPALSST